MQLAQLYVDVAHTQNTFLPPLLTQSLHSSKFAKELKATPTNDFREGISCSQLGDSSNHNYKSQAIGNHNIEVASISADIATKSRPSKRIAAIQNHGLVVATYSGAFPALWCASPKHYKNCKTERSRVLRAPCLDSQNERTSRGAPLAWGFAAAARPPHLWGSWSSVPKDRLSRNPVLFMQTSTC